MDKGNYEQVIADIASANVIKLFIAVSYIFS